MPEYIIDVDKSADYEELSLLRRILDFFFLPVLNALPGGFRKLIKKSNRSAGEVIDNATTHTALEILYNHGHPSENTGLLQKFFLKIWFNLHNSKAVRNRLKLVSKEIEVAIEEADRRSDEIRILSIASGSARAILESIDKVDLEDNKVNVTFLDKSPKALNYSRSLRKEILGEEGNFVWVEDTARNFTEYIEERNSLDLVEIVGLLDYFDKEKVLAVFKSIYDHLAPGGKLITANIVDNKERPFITKVIDWKMIYRKPEELIDLAVEAGFERDKVKALYEPLKVHVVIIAQK